MALLQRRPFIPEKPGRKSRYVSEAENYLSDSSVNSLEEKDGNTPVQDSDCLRDEGSCPNQNMPIFWRPWNGSRRPFRCRTCNSEKTFKRDPELKRHMRTTHMNQIERCSVCKQEFTRKDNLTRHMKSKHNVRGKPACKFCSKELSRKDAVHRHEGSCPQNDKRSPQISFHEQKMSGTAPGPLHPAQES